MKKIVIIKILFFCFVIDNFVFANLLNISNGNNEEIYYVSNNELFEKKFVDKKGEEILNVNGVYSDLYKIFDLYTNEVKYLIKSDKHIREDVYFFGHNRYSNIDDTLFSISGEKINNIVHIYSKYNIEYICCWNNYIVYSVKGWGNDDVVNMLNKNVEFDKVDEEEDDDMLHHSFLVLYDIVNNKNITINHWQEGSYDLLGNSDYLFTFTVLGNNQMRIKTIDTNGNAIKNSIFEEEDFANNIELYYKRPFGNVIHGFRYEGRNVSDIYKLKSAYKLMMDDSVYGNENKESYIDDNAIINDIEETMSSTLDNGTIKIKKYLANKLTNYTESKNTNISYYDTYGSAYYSERKIGKKIDGKFFRVINDKVYVFDCEDFRDDMNLYDYTFTIKDDSNNVLARDIKFCNKETIVHYGIDYAERNTPTFYCEKALEMEEKWYNSEILEKITDINYYRLKKNGKYSLISFDGKVIFDDIDNYSIDEFYSGERKYIINKNNQWIIIDETGEILAKDFDINYDRSRIVKLGDKKFVLFFYDYDYDFDYEFFDSYRVDLYNQNGAIRKNLKQCDVIDNKYFNIVSPLNYGLIDDTGKWFSKFSAFDNLVFD